MSRHSVQAQLLVALVLLGYVVCIVSAGFIVDDGPPQLPSGYAAPLHQPQGCALGRWRQHCVPYVIDVESFPIDERAEWISAIDGAAGAINAALIPLDTQLAASSRSPASVGVESRPCNWIEFTYSHQGSCSSLYGREEYQVSRDTHAKVQGDVCLRRASPIRLTASCYFTRDGSVLHELMHRLGVCHEHQRHRALDFVDMFPSNYDGDVINLHPYDSPELADALAAESSPGNLAVLPGCSVVGNYDVNSRMHYPGRRAYAPDSEPAYMKLRSQATLEQGDLGPPHDGDAVLTAGDRAALRQVLVPCSGDDWLDTRGNAWCSGGNLGLWWGAGAAAAIMVAGAGGYYSRKRSQRQAVVAEKRKRRQQERRDRRQRRQSRRADDDNLDMQEAVDDPGLGAKDDWRASVQGSSDRLSRNSISKVDDDEQRSTGSGLGKRHHRRSGSRSSVSMMEA